MSGLLRPCCALSSAPGTDITNITNIGTGCSKCSKCPNCPKCTKDLTNQLMEAIHSGDVGKMKELVLHGVPIEAFVSLMQKMSPADLATICKTCPRCLFAGSLEDEPWDIRGTDGKRPIHFASEMGQVQIVKWLASAGVPLDAKADDGEVGGLEPLHIASRHGHLELAQWLVSEGVAIDVLTDSSSLQPIHLACSNNHLELADWLLQQGASFTARATDGSEPLHLACRNGSLETVKWMVNKGARVMTDSMGGVQPFHEACMLGNFEVVKWIGTEYKEQLDLVVGSKMTPMHLACLQGHLEIVKWLVGAGVPVGTLNSENLKILFIAAAKHTPVHEYLQREAGLGASETKALQKSCLDAAGTTSAELRDESAAVDKDSVQNPIPKEQPAASYGCAGRETLNLFFSGRRARGNRDCVARPYDAIRDALDNRVYAEARAACASHEARQAANRKAKAAAAAKEQPSVAPHEGTETEAINQKGGSTKTTKKKKQKEDDDGLEADTQINSQKQMSAKAIKKKKQKEEDEELQLFGWASCLNPANAEKARRQAEEFLQEGDAGKKKKKQRSRGGKKKVAGAGGVDCGRDKVSSLVDGTAAVSQPQLSAGCKDKAAGVSGVAGQVKECSGSGPEVVIADKQPESCDVSGGAGGEGQLQDVEVAVASMSSIQIQVPAWLSSNKEESSSPDTAEDPFASLLDTFQSEDASAAARKQLKHQQKKAKRQAKKVAEAIAVLKESLCSEVDMVALGETITKGEQLCESGAAVGTELGSLLVAARNHLELAQTQLPHSAPHREAAESPEQLQVSPLRLLPQGLLDSPGKQAAPESDEQAERDAERNLMRRGVQLGQTLATLPPDVEAAMGGQTGIQAVEDEFVALALNQEAERSAAEEQRVVEEDKLCVVCMAEPKEYLFAPCGHMCACSDCADLVINKDALCPICRKDIACKIKVYM